MLKFAIGIPVWVVITASLYLARITGRKEEENKPDLYLVSGSYATENGAGNIHEWYTEEQLRDFDMQAFDDMARTRRGEPTVLSTGMVANWKTFCENSDDDSIPPGDQEARLAVVQSEQGDPLPPIQNELIDPDNGSGTELVKSPAGGEEQLGTSGGSPTDGTQSELPSSTTPTAGPADDATTSADAKAPAPVETKNKNDKKDKAKKS
jgi:hypothetical protein